MASDIYWFARFIHDSSPELKVAYGSKAVVSAVQRAFGSTLVDIDTQEPEAHAVVALLHGVETALADEFRKERTPRTYVFGCWMIRDEVASDLNFGPVRFQRKQSWLDQALRDGQVSPLIYRRIKRQWEGGRSKPLKNQTDQWRENSILRAVGDCPEICTVMTNGLSDDAAYEKALLAAKLAMTAVALLWERPSNAMEGFGLLIERRRPFERYVVFGPAGKMGSYNGLSSKPVGSTWVPEDEWAKIWGKWLTDPVIELLTSYLDPSREIVRPAVSGRLLHALWWLHEACRAEAPLMASVKFAACLNSLAGGQSEGRMLRLIEARLGPQADEPITRDGRTAKSVIKMLYGQARSRTLHGNNDILDHDWRSSRELAEHLVRRCFVEVLSWLEEHPEATDLDSALELPGKP